MTARGIGKAIIVGLAVEGIIVPLGGNRSGFEIGAGGVPGLPGTTPVTVRLTIGQTTGSASVGAPFETGDRPDVEVTCLDATPSSGDP